MIDGSIYIEDLVNNHPEVIAPLAEMGIVCVACGEPIWGTLGELILSKDIANPEEVYSKINNIITKK
jgi:hypothetical protein